MIIQSSNCQLIWNRLLEFLYYCTVVNPLRQAWGQLDSICYKISLYVKGEKNQCNRLQREMFSKLNLLMDKMFFQNYFFDVWMRDILLAENTCNWITCSTCFASCFSLYQKRGRQECSMWKIQFSCIYFCKEDVSHSYIIECDVHCQRGAWSTIVFQESGRR